MSGQWVFVCGPSGAGKDSVMSWAAQQLAARTELVFARRMVTRPRHQGSDHDPVSVTQFGKLASQGQLAWQWQAHGFCYGVDAAYTRQVSSGKVVVVNGSREHCMGLEGHPKVKVVQITTDAQTLIERLAQRGRESPHEVNQRLARNAKFTQWHADFTVFNQGELADAGLRLVDYLVEVATPSFSSNKGVT
jgi:phosphonate metabolism protein PhnN/1,5-bisphosphokinase (PRPP-forming)